MPSTGLIIAGSGTNVAGGSVNWTNPGNITADDAANATFSIPTSSSTNYLTAGLFGIALPSGSVVSGVECEIQLNNDKSGLIYLTKDGTVIAGTGKSIFLTTVLTVLTYGSPTDLWGTTLTEAEVETSTFGIMVRYTSTGIAAASGAVDYIKVNVHYTTFSLPNLDLSKHPRMNMRH